MKTTLDNRGRFRLHAVAQSSEDGLAPVLPRTPSNSTEAARLGSFVHSKARHERRASRAANAEPLVNAHETFLDDIDFQAERAGNSALLEPRTQLGYGQPLPLPPLANGTSTIATEVIRSIPRITIPALGVTFPMHLHLAHVVTAIIDRDANGISTAFQLVVGLIRSPLRNQKSEVRQAVMAELCAALAENQTPMPDETCNRLGVPLRSSFAEGAEKYVALCRLGSDPIQIP